MPFNKKMRVAKLFTFFRILVTMRAEDTSDPRPVIFEISICRRNENDQVQVSHRAGIGLHADAVLLILCSCRHVHSPYRPVIGSCQPEPHASAAHTRHQCAVHDFQLPGRAGCGTQFRGRSGKGLGNL